MVTSRRAVELGTVGAVELAPPPVAVGAEPQIWLLHVAEQQELADLPQRRHADHVVDPLALDVHVRRPRLVVPVQGQVLGPAVVDADPAGGEAVAENERCSATPSSLPPSGLRCQPPRRMGVCLA